MADHEIVRRAFATPTEDVVTPRAGGRPRPPRPWRRGDTSSSKATARRLFGQEFGRGKASTRSTSCADEAAIRPPETRQIAPRQHVPCTSRGDVARLLSLNMDVTRETFAASLEALDAAIEDPHFAFWTFDLEFTGLSADRSTKFDLFDTIPERWRKVHACVSQFTVLQYGVCCFAFDPKSRRWTVRPFNFWPFPEGVPGVDGEPCLRLLPPGPCRAATSHRQRRASARACRSRRAPRRAERGGARAPGSSRDRRSPLQRAGTSPPSARRPPGSGRRRAPMHGR